MEEMKLVINSHRYYYYRENSLSGSMRQQAIELLTRSNDYTNNIEVGTGEIMSSL